MKKIVVIILSLILILTIITITITYNINKQEIHSNKKTEILNEFIIDSKENNIVNVIIKRTDGIKEVKCPNGNIIYGNNKTAISVDQIVEPNKKYTFEIINNNGTIESESFITPNIHIGITRNDIEVNLNEVKDTLVTQMNQSKIATNFLNIETGEQQYVDSQETDMEEVFKNWTKFGDGNWSYNSSTKIIANSKNSSYPTGYYPANEVYTDIDFSFNARTTDSDDDVIGAMLRLNESSSTYSAYIFSIDRHDTSGGGMAKGAYNGLCKITNDTFLTFNNMIKLSVNPSLRWTRSQWQNYRLVASGNKIEAYIDGTLVASTTDSSISRGSYGFLSYSQAKSYFKDIKIHANKEYSLTEMVDKITWDSSEINIIINLNNKSEAVLTTQDCINIFKNNNIHYLGVTSTTNKDAVEKFIGNINNKGQWIDSIDYNTYINTINQYIVDYSNSIIL